jgi:hypothetical protein
MSSAFVSSDDLSLALVNAMVNGTSSVSSLAALEAWNNRTNETVGVCGFPCLGDCRTCVQSNADLTAFFAPEASASPVEPEAVVVRASEASASIEGASSSALTDEQWEEVVRASRALDEAEEAARGGIWADNGQDYDGPDRAEPADDDDYRGCQCLDCLNHDDQDYVPSYDDRQDDYDDGYGLDWNESGYFD